MKSSFNKISFSFVLFAAFGISGCQKESVFKTYSKPEVTISANDFRLATDIIHLVKDTVYVLATNINRNSGQKLMVDAGTLIKVADGIAVTINRGARIEAVGTAAEPIIFTSSAAKGAPGFINYSSPASEHSWLGISIYGNYPDAIDNTNKGTGMLDFVRIEFAGRSFSLNNFTNLPSLLLQNIGKGTVIKNIQISYSVSYSSFLISGGNADMNNLISYAAGNTDFYLLDGYKGLLQNILAYRHPYFSPQIGSGTTLAGLLISGDLTFPIISNMTILGPDLQVGTNKKYFDTLSAGFGSKVAGCIVNSGRFHIRNSVVMGFPKVALYIDGKLTTRSIEDGSSDFKYSIYHSNDSGRTFLLTPKIYKQYVSKDLKDLLLRSDYGGQQFLSSAAFNFIDPFSYNHNPNPAPLVSSAVLTGANFDDPYFDNPFFKKVTYRGAIGTDNWLQGWTNFIPLQTNYNN